MLTVSTRGRGRKEEKQKQKQIHTIYSSCKISARRRRTQRHMRILAYFWRRPTAPWQSCQWRTCSRCSESWSGTRTWKGLREREQASANINNNYDNADDNNNNDNNNETCMFVAWCENVLHGFDVCAYLQRVARWGQPESTRKPVSGKKIPVLEQLSQRYAERSDTDLKCTWMYCSRNGTRSSEKRPCERST